MSREIRQINFYNEFKCLGGNCPSTCCKGWLVPVDDSSLKKYKNLKNMDSLKILLGIRKKSGLKCLNPTLRKCTFLRKDGLCHLQKKYGEDYLCEVCSVFPRTIYNIYSDELSADKLPYDELPSCESPIYDSSLPCAWHFLELSCPEAARLFILHINDIKIQTVTGTTSGDISVTNDDVNYYRFLIELNDSLCKTITDSVLTLGQVYRYLIDFSQSLQECFLNGEDPYYLLKEFNESQIYSQPENYHIPAAIIDKIMTGGYYHPRVKNESEFLYKLCQLYFKSFDKLSISNIDSIMKNLPNETLCDSELGFSMEDFLRRHLAYVLSSTFAELYEDYSFTNKFVIAIARNQLLSMFIWLYSHNVEPINTDNLCKILYSFHRRGAGNEGLYSDICKIICNSIYK